ncbi:hypothetical protein V8C37DRAFT_373063 [Trichoderma ceciliae]
MDGERQKTTVERGDTRDGDDGCDDSMMMTTLMTIYFFLLLRQCHVFPPLFSSNLVTIHEMFAFIYLVQEMLGNVLFCVLFLLPCLRFIEKKRVLGIFQ